MFTPGSTVGSWSLVSLRRDGLSRKRWVCLCVCGTLREVFEHTLRQGRSFSCGCSRGARITAAKSTHGEAAQRTRTKEYRIWANMMTRCTNPANVAFRDYGARGITVCAAWHTYENFLRDMGRCPSGMSLDREDNDGPYTKENCRWVPLKVQMNNTRRTRRLSYAGKTQSLQQWANELGVPRQRVQHRLRLGWTVEEALHGR